MEGTRKVKQSPGFTLIELLVVIAIAAILLVLGFGSLSKAKDGALNAKCIGNLRSLGGLVNTYLSEHGIYPGSTTEDGFPWYMALEQYAGREDAAKISEAGKYRPSDVFRCPRRGYEDEAKVGYAYNYVGFGFEPPNMDEDLPPDLWFAKIYWHLRPAQVINPGRRIVIGDSFDIGNGQPESAMYLYQSSPVQAHRHSGGGNYLWADGHVEWITPDALWYRNRDPEHSPYLPFPRP
jgi:prepilin-type processing-associated H-X9-DG protein/prepilin-type N-terminal cleavage/methylation domain-containing protein